MIDTVELQDPDGKTVYASKAGAAVLRDEHGYTDAPPSAPSDPAPAPEGPSDPPADDQPADPPADGEPEVKDPAAPRGNASRADWAAYAEQLGLPVGEDDSREDIKAALADLER